MNSFEQRILFSVIKNKQLDFTQLIFNQIDEIIRGNKSSTHVPYPRWFELILIYVGTDYVEDQAEDWIHSFTSSTLFNLDLDYD